MFGFGKRKTSAPEEAKKTPGDIDKELAKRRRQGLDVEQGQSAELGIFAAPVDEDDDNDLEDELLALIRDDPSPSPRKPQARSPQPQAVSVESTQPVQSPPTNWSSGQVLQPTPAFVSPILEPTPAPPPRRPPPPQQQSPIKTNPTAVVSPPSPRPSQSTPVIQPQLRPKVTTSDQGVGSTAPEKSDGQPDLVSNLPADLFKAPPPPRTVLQALEQRLAKYKSEVDKANETSNTSKARRMGRIVKQYDDAISAHRKGRAVPFDELPTPPGFAPIPGLVMTPSPSHQDSIAPAVPNVAARTSAGPMVCPERPITGHSIVRDDPSAQVRPKVTTPVPGAVSAAAPKPRQPAPATERSTEASILEPAAAAQPDLVSDLPSDLFKAPPPPRTVLQALEQRLVKYKSEVEKANETANTSKARRMGRIVKQYDDAISAHKKGKPVPFDELPTPPGFPPIPGQVTAPSPSLQDSLAPAPAAGAADLAGVYPEKPAAAGAAGPAIVRGGTKSGGKLTVQEKQLAVILARQKQFKSAALAAKQRGDLNQARELLRTAKGFDKLIQVSQSGLPVDMATLPAGPESIAALEAEDFEIVTSSDCIPASMGAADVFAKLEEDLKEQLRTCMRTRDHFKSMGDIGSANRFEHMALESKRDLDTLRLAARKGDVLPSYHYETRVFSITECNSDLGEDDLEVNVLKGINYKAGSSSDTFVKVELQYPSAEQAQINKTAVVSNAEYGSIYKLSINRSARNFHRFVHRHGVKLEVWSKGGFLRSSTLMGTATAKLLPLETKCTLHEAFDILEGRKSIGKLEVKIRVREPILTKQISQQKQKWLSIDRT